MKLKKLLLVGAIIGGSTFGYSHFAQAATTAGTANALIRAIVVLTESAQLDFGEITPDPVGDTITITPAGAVSGTGTSTFAGAATAGAWTATGDASAAVTISFSAGDTLAGPGTAMGLGNFVHNAGGAPAFDGGGDLAFSVGGDLTVGAAQTAGAYSGAYSVTVNY